MQKFQAFLKKWGWVFAVLGGGTVCACNSGCELLGLQTSVNKPASCETLTGWSAPCDRKTLK